MLTPEPIQNAESFEDFLAAMEPKLKRLLAVYRIPADDAEDVLQQALLALLYQWERVRDPESWLFGTVKQHCLMYWRTHKRRIYLAVDSTILEWLSEPIAPNQEKTDLLCDLESLIHQLPRAAGRSCGCASGWDTRHPRWRRCSAIASRASARSPRAASPRCRASSWPPAWSRSRRRRPAEPEPLEVEAIPEDAEPPLR